MYRIDTLSDEGAIKEEDDNGGEILIPQPNRLQLSFEKVSATGKILLPMLAIRAHRGTNIQKEFEKMGLNALENR